MVTTVGRGRFTSRLDLSALDSNFDQYLARPEQGSSSSLVVGLVGRVQLHRPSFFMSWTRSLRVNFHEGRGFLWVGSVFIGAWYNTTDAGLTPAQRSTQIALAVALVPVAGVLEGSSGLWAVSDWLRGRREVIWHPTPKTKAADSALVHKATAA